MKVSTVIQARVERDKILHPPQPWGSQGKAFAPPFLESLRAWNRAGCVSPDCCTAAPSARLPSPGQRITRGGHTPLDEGAAESSCPRFPGQSQQQRARGSAPPLLGQWAVNSHPCPSATEGSPVKGKGNGIQISSSNFHTVQDPVKIVTLIKNQETKY